jgi:hypothetical protein
MNITSKDIFYNAFSKYSKQNDDEKYEITLSLIDKSEKEVNL